MGERQQNIACLPSEIREDHQCHEIDHSTRRLLQRWSRNSQEYLHSATEIRYPNETNSKMRLTITS